VDARAVEEAAEQLRQLRYEEWLDLVLAALLLGFGTAAAQFWHALESPLIVGSLGVGTLAVRAFWRRWNLIQDLESERDAYTIPEVRRRAAKAASMRNRLILAASTRSMVREPGLALAKRVAACTRELEALSSELERSSLVLDPACAVLCDRLLTDGGESPLLNPALPADDAFTRIRQIRGGFGTSPLSQHGLPPPVGSRRLQPGASAAPLRHAALARSTANKKPRSACRRPCSRPHVDLTLTQIGVLRDNVRSHERWSRCD
jgi:hypothetical protein